MVSGFGKEFPKLSVSGKKIIRFWEKSTYPFLGSVFGNKASFLSEFGKNPEFLLPEKCFLRNSESTHFFLLFYILYFIFYIL